ncbi:extracellular solute-binding protein [Acidithiobacillus sulfuriphilus]|uniref:extracellular solute-binding protein n=1 Tax=Acidithiobacillus sulfuriphilus TaxID=1867749 RepID=UPI003F6250C4
MIRVLLLAFTFLISSVADAATLVVYSSAPASLAKQLAAAFEKKTGDQVALYTASTGKVMARLAAEADHPHADVVILADWTAGLALAKDDMVFPYHPAALATLLRKPLQLAGPFLPLGADTVSIVMNTQALPKGATLPDDWFALTAPEWRDRLTMPNPLLSGTASDFVLAFVDEYGAKAWQYFSALKANGCIWPGTNHASLQPVEMGERSGMVAAVGHTALLAKLAGNSLELIHPKSGMLLIPRPIMIMKSAANRPLAEQFVDFTLSKDGQELVAKSLLLPARKDVTPDSVWPNLDKLHFLPVHWDAIASQRTSVLARFRKEILGQ